MKTHYCFLVKSQEIMNSLYQIDFASPKIGDKSPIPEIIGIFDKERDLASWGMIGLGIKKLVCDVEQAPGLSFVNFIISIVDEFGSIYRKI